MPTWVWNQAVFLCIVRPGRNLLGKTGVHRLVFSSYFHFIASIRMKHLEYDEYIWDSDVVFADQPVALLPDNLN